MCIQRSNSVLGICYWQGRDNPAGDNEFITVTHLWFVTFQTRSVCIQLPMCLKDTVIAMTSHYLLISRKPSLLLGCTVPIVRYSGCTVLRLTKRKKKGDRVFCLYEDTTSIWCKVCWLFLTAFVEMLDQTGKRGDATLTALHRTPVCGRISRRDLLINSKRTQLPNVTLEFCAGNHLEMTMIIVIYLLFA